MLRRAAFVLLIAGVLAMPQAARGDGIVIYRCTDAFGQVTLQNGVACPKGTHEQRRTVQPAPALEAYRAPQPLPTSPAAPIVRATAADAPNPSPPAGDAGTSDLVPPAERLPPPPLFQCRTWDNDSYLSDDGEPAPRCVPLTVQGIGGQASLAAGAACQMVTDQCQRIGDDAACEAWHKRAREAEAGWRFAPAELAAQRRETFERVSRILRESTCAP